MSKTYSFALRGGSQVTRTFLPSTTDLDQVYPQRVYITQTRTGTVWGVSGSELLLILDERQGCGSVEDVVTVFAFDTDSTSLSVYAQIVEALVREGTAQNKARNRSSGGNGSPVIVIPSTKRQGEWHELLVPTIQAWRRQTKYDA